MLEANAEDSKPITPKNNTKMERVSIYIQNNAKLTVTPNKSREQKKLSTEFISGLTMDKLSELKRIYSICDSDNRGYISFTAVIDCKSIGTVVDIYIYGILEERNNEEGHIHRRRQLAARDVFKVNSHILLG